MSASTLPDVWATRDYPVLIAAAQLLDADGLPHTSDEIAEVAGIERAAVVRALVNLGHGFLEVRSESSINEEDCFVTGITAEGLRAAGQWPSPETAADRLISALDEQIDNTVEGTPKASRLHTLRDNITSVGRDVLVEVMGGVLTGRIPM